jgi:ABC-type branched-subunit amino acid transport system ATPase component
LNDSPILVAEGLEKRFGGVPAVNAATLAVASGSITALIGPNGAGKTSLFNLISGFQRPDLGHVTFSGRRIDRLPVHEIVRAGLVRTFQQAKILRRMSVLENMLLAAPRQPGESLWRLPLPRASVRRERELVRKAVDILHSVRLEKHASDYAGTLSGGQRKLLEFARVLMTEPRMVLLDEPMAGVNPALRQQLLTQIVTSRKERNITFFLIEHDLESVMAVSDTVAVMNAGRVIFSGSPREVQGNIDVIDAYLGTAGGRGTEAAP